MRRWLLIIMLLVYPFQASLAMADQCCMATPAGLTHHGAGEGDGPGVAQPVFLAGEAGSALADPHCPACVFGQIPGVPLDTATLPAVARHPPAIASSIPFLASVPRSRPERPNWPPAAT